MEDFTGKIDLELLQTITPEQAHHYGIIPKDANLNTITFWIDENKLTSQAKHELTALFGKKIVLKKIESKKIEKTLSTYYRFNSQIKKINSDDFFERILQEAEALGSSDIHIESYEKSCRLRMRLDGKLVERYSIPQNEYPVLVNKIKIRSDLDIAEKRLPQDGRIRWEEKELDIRVSISPTHFGEKVVLRLLSRNATKVDLNELGFEKVQLESYLKGIRKSQGLVLISGPTGSGKTTSLYATLKLLNTSQSNILTIEDPIEYTLNGINQVQLKETIGLDFPKALKTFLRQDPDIIMVGEIRDVETAQMAIRAALTGHLVLSTIHTNSAWGTIARLINMGIPSYLIASTLNLTVAQRLVRILCQSCKREEAMKTNTLPIAYKNKKLTTHFVAEGCENCHYTGYKGRKAIYDVIAIDNQLATIIKENKEYKNSKNNLAETAFNLLSSGTSSLEEIYPILLS
ncbi:GspE/PulE family protein [Flavobacteriales bacterium]|nr:GspE/PulE family protein [Flavobacteriales bacterium]